ALVTEFANGGLLVISRIPMLIWLPLACAGCAQEALSPLASYAGASEVLNSSLPHGYADAARLEAAVETVETARKTLAAKVLAAIALERVTGAKPDPARFAHLT